MRVTETIIANTLLSNLQMGQSRLERLQQQSSSGLKISAPGDDPVSAEQIVQLNGMLQSNEQYARNISTGSAWLEQSDSAMSDMGNVVARIRELAVAMANGTYDALDRNNVATEINQLKEELIQLGNTQVAGRYIFGGFVSDKPPFDSVSGNYLGTTDMVKMEISQGAYVSINVDGGQLFRGGIPAGSTGVDLIGEVQKLYTALTTNDVATVKASLPSLTIAQDQILAIRSDVGARMNRVQTASSSLESMAISLKKVVSSKQDVDILKIASELISEQNAFEVALSATAKTAQLSLLDYLR